MKNKYIIIKLSLFFLILCSAQFSIAEENKNKYVIAIRDSLKNTEWMSVVKELELNHKNSVVLFYENSLQDIFAPLKDINPRYLCVVDIPKNINRDFVIQGNRMSRMIDDDIYDDYIWGIITGYTVGDALRIVRQSSESFVLKTALSTTSEVSDGRWFSKFAWLDDGLRTGAKGKWGEKKSLNDTCVIHDQENLYHFLPIFKKKWEEIDPDFVITSSHATQYNLEMPYSSGNIKAKDGQLYANFNTPQDLSLTNKPRVYFPVGNCLIGDIDNSPQSMAVAWLSSGGATAMLGYVVSTWYGRNGWGALKFFLSNPGKLTLAEAAYLNRQDMLTQEMRRNPKLLNIIPDFSTYGDGARYQIEYELNALDNVAHNRDDIGFIYDRDVVVYYGDPAWDVKVQNPYKSEGYEFKIEQKDGRYIITLTTSEDFSIEKFAGKGFKEEHVKDIPLSYFFPFPIRSPRVVENKSNLDIACDENFLLIYNKNLKPNEVYQIVLE